MRLITRFMLWIISGILALGIIAYGAYMSFTETDWGAIGRDYKEALTIPGFTIPSIPEDPFKTSDLQESSTNPAESTEVGESSESTDSTEIN